jgi:hypothetical protein
MDYAKMENVNVTMDLKENSVKSQFARIIVVIKDIVIKGNAIA